MNAILRAFALALLSMLAACTSVVTENPIGISNGTVSDLRIVGAWKAMTPENNSKDEAYVFVLPHEKTPLEGMLVVQSDRDWWTSDLVLGKAGAHTMINVKVLLKNRVPVSAKDMPAGYFPLRYVVNADGSIQLFIWTAETVKNAIESGAIAGTLVSASDIRITAEPKALDTFFAASAATVFAEPFGTLVRLK